MLYDNKIWIGSTSDTKEKLFLNLKMANRHGLIAGATGTGKTVTLKVLAESFSNAGVPVFLADVKGDLAGMINPGELNENIQKRMDYFGLEEAGYKMQSFPTAFWDIYCNGGIPVRTTISEMGPLLLAKLMGLNDTQTALLTVVFKIADDEELLLIDTKDLKAMLNYVGDHAEDFAADYGHIAKVSINTIIRGVVALESKGADQFFMEPGLNISDWFNSEMGKGVINILDCRELLNDGTLYATFLLWMLSELFETLPEIGDPEKPRMVFFFDEAHLLFNDISKALQEKIEQVIKLIRSKGVGIFFVTQNPSDIPDSVLAQLGNKIQHALRAYTPKEEKGIRAVAESFRVNPAFDTKTVLMEMGTGEALVSLLDDKGIPGIVQYAKILPPESQMGGIDDEVRSKCVLANNLYLKYKDMFDRDSAYEFFLRLQKQQLEQEEANALELARMKEELAAQKAAEKEAAAAQKAAEKEALALQKERERQALAQQKELAREAEKIRKEQQKAEERRYKEAMKAIEKENAARLKEQQKQQKAMQTTMKRAASSVAGTVGREVGNSLGKSIGGSFGKKIGGNLGASLGRNILGTFFKG